MRLLLLLLLFSFPENGFAEQERTFEDGCRLAREYFVAYKLKYPALRVNADHSAKNTCSEQLLGTFPDRATPDVSTAFESHHEWKISSNESKDGPLQSVDVWVNQDARCTITTDYSPDVEMGRPRGTTPDFQRVRCEAPPQAEVDVFASLGEDRNKNGIWDDAEPTIAKLAGGSKKLEKALVQLTKGFQESMTTGDQTNFLRPMNCLRYVAPERGDSIAEELRHSLIISDKRDNAFYRPSKKRSIFYTLPNINQLKDECDFDPDKEKS